MKGGAHVAGGAVAVVGQGFDDDADAAGAEAFVAHLIELLGARPRAAIHRALDVVLRHVLRPACRDGAKEARIGVRVRPAQLHRRLDFARDLGEDLRALLILPALAVLNVREF